MCIRDRLGKDDILTVYPAITSCQYDMVKLLCSHGAKFQDYFNEAIRSSSPEIVELLISYGADINKKEYFDGKTPFDEAISSGRDEIIRVMISEQANQYENLMSGSKRSLIREVYATIIVSMIVVFIFKRFYY